VVTGGTDDRDMTRVLRDETGRGSTAANETLRELAPLLAEEGIDVDNIDVPDLDTRQQALNRAVERHNMTRSPRWARHANW
jgi:hypothetical protein